jgi:hypothetical protein
MTENLGVFASYGRGWDVLRGNFGQAVVLFLIQIGLGIGLAIVLALPSFLAALCCLLWPVLLALSGAVQAYFSTLWTLAWRVWVSAGTAPGEPISPMPVAMG